MSLFAALSDREDRSQWWPIAACFVSAIFGAAPLLLYLQGVFLKPMTQEFGWSRAEYFLPLSIAGVVAALAMPLAGLAADRYGARRPLLFAIPAFGLFAASIALLPNSYVAYSLVIIALLVTSTVYGPIFYSKVAVTAGIALRRPALAVAIAGAGFGLGGMVLPPLAEWLIADFGWRVARAVLGTSVILLSLPAALLFIWRPGPTMARTAPGDDEAAGLSFAQALRTGTFWILLGALTIAAILMGGILGNLPAILTDRGVDSATATLSLSAFAAAHVTGRLMSGLILDRFDTPRAASLWFAVAALGAGLLYGPWGTPFLVTGAMFVGAALGCESEIAAYFTLRFFGSRAFGRIFGVFMAAFTIGTTLGPALLALSHDRSGSYAMGLSFAVWGLLAAFLAMLSFRKYRFAKSSESGGAG